MPSCQGEATRMRRMDEWIGVVRFDSGEKHFCEEPMPTRELAIIDARDDARGGGPHTAWAIKVGGRAHRERQARIDRNLAAMGRDC